MNIVYELLGGLKIGVVGWVNGVGIGECVFAIIVMFFIKQAEPIVRKIFGFDNAGSLGSALASGALLVKSMTTASNAIDKARQKKKGEKGTGGNTSKPQPSSNANRNTTNINNATQNPPSNTPAKVKVTKVKQNSSTSGGKNGNGNVIPVKSHIAPEGNTQSSKSSNSGQNSTTQNNNQPGNRNLDTSRIGESEDEKKQKVKDMAKKIAGTYVDIGFRAAGIAIGAFASEDAITGGVTGFQFGTAFGEGAKDLGERAVGAGRKIVNKATRRKKLNKSTNELIDKYNEIKTKTGWTDEAMFTLSEYYLNETDVSKENDPKLREYATTLHKYREAFIEDYNNPNETVLDAIKKIQTGELDKTDESIKKYTRKK